MDDERFPRLWYLPNGELISPRANDAENVNKSALRRVTTWPNVQAWNENEFGKSPCIFLSRSPLTFGHSQLVVPLKHDCDEEHLFQLASIIISCAIATFRKAFADQRLHEKEDFKSLAEKTLTYGSYEKTLVLRASAQEKCEKSPIKYEYKVHLVPYFASHASLCKNRYRSLHASKPGDDETGGLLGWLGEREDDVDRWEADNTHKTNLDSIANGVLRCPTLLRNCVSFSYSGRPTGA